MTALLGTFMIHPFMLNRWEQMSMLIPLCLAISIVYKTTKCEKVKDIPIAASISCITIVIGMYAVGAVLYWLYELAT